MLCGVLLVILRRVRTLGETAAWGLVLGGLLVFVVDFFRLPQVLYGTMPLDSVQWHAMTAMGAGGLLLAWCFGAGVGAKAMPVAKDVGDAV